MIIIYFLKIKKKRLSDKILILLFICKQYLKCILKEWHITEKSIIIVMLLNYRMVDILSAHLVGNSDFVAEKLCEK